ncbi:MAG: ATP-grasp domain-containing protein, partial [Nitrososphaeria archaeon]|nr:ATP-grasp domain-containing protein [Nitrososphaeria archaeon]NIQ33675.1 ATP-grasp domain-containing protein [Nitrososphaeria archaeon]
MVRIHEYMGKQLLKEVGASTPRGEVASTAEEARKIAEQIGKPVAVKAQIWTTGRFKAGGIKFASNSDEAEAAASGLLGSNIKGLKVEKVLIEERLDIDKEFYVGVITDGSYKVKGPVMMFSTEGGVDIEQVAEKHPEKVAKKVVDYLEGVKKSDAKKLVSKLDVPEILVDPIADAVSSLYQLFKQYDARAAEINPLVSTKDGEIYAADCRVSIDDSSVFRHPEFEVEVPRDMERPPTELEKMAWKIEEDDYRGTAYFTQIVTEVGEEGYVAFHGIGGGGAMLAADALMQRGLKIANYADTSGDPTASKVYRIIKAALSQPGVEAYVMMGSAFASQEQWHHAHAIVKAFKEEAAQRPGFPVLI